MSHLLLTEFEVCTYVTNRVFFFFAWPFMAQARSAREINRGSVTYISDQENEVSKIFMRWGRYLSSRTAIADWRASNPKREDGLLGSTKSDLSRQNVRSNFKFKIKIFYKVFFKSHFAWRLKQTFEFSEPYSTVRPAKLTNDSARTNWEL